MTQSCRRARKLLFTSFLFFSDSNFHFRSSSNSLELNNWNIQIRGKLVRDKGKWIRGWVQIFRSKFKIRNTVSLETREIQSWKEWLSDSTIENNFSRGAKLRHSSYRDEPASQLSPPFEYFGGCRCIKSVHLNIGKLGRCKRASYGETGISSRPIEPNFFPPTYSSNHPFLPLPIFPLFFPTRKLTLERDWRGVARISFVLRPLPPFLWPRDG